MVNSEITKKPIRWKLKNFLEQHKITPYKLAQKVKDNGGKTHMTTIYRITGETSTPMPFSARILEEIGWALRQLMGKEVTPNDLIEFRSEVKQKTRAKKLEGKK